MTFLLIGKPSSGAPVGDNIRWNTDACRSKNIELQLHQQWRDSTAVAGVGRRHFRQTNCQAETRKTGDASRQADEAGRQNGVIFSQLYLANENYKLGCQMFLWMNVFTLSVRLACDSHRHEWLLRIRYWFTSNHIPPRFSCRPREASRLEAKTHEAEATTHEAEVTTHEAEAEAQVFRPRGRGQASRPNITGSW